MIDPLIGFAVLAAFAVAFRALHHSQVESRQMVELALHAERERRARTAELDDVRFAASRGRVDPAAKRDADEEARFALAFGRSPSVSNGSTTAEVEPVEVQPSGSGSGVRPVDAFRVP